MPSYTDRPSCSPEPAINYQNPNCTDATRLQAWLVRREAEVHSSNSEAAGQLERLGRIRAFADYAARAIGRQAFDLDPATKTLEAANFQAERELLLQLPSDELAEYLMTYLGSTALEGLTGDASDVGKVVDPPVT